MWGSEFRLNTVGKLCFQVCEIDNLEGYSKINLSICYLVYSTPSCPCGFFKALFFKVLLMFYTFSEIMNWNLFLVVIFVFSNSSIAAKL